MIPAGALLDAVVDAFADVPGVAIGLRPFRADDGAYRVTVWEEPFNRHVALRVDEQLDAPVADLAARLRQQWDAST